MKNLSLNALLIKGKKRTGVRFPDGSIEWYDDFNEALRTKQSYNLRKKLK